MGNTSRVVQIPARRLAGKLKELKAGESLNFATEYQTDGEKPLITEDDLCGWCGAKRERLFNHDIIVIAGFDSGYTGSVSLEGEFVDDDILQEVELCFDTCMTEYAYIVVPEKPVCDESLCFNDDGSILIKRELDGSYCEITISQYERWEITKRHEVSCTEEDIIRRIEDTSKAVGEISSESLRFMASDVIHRRENSDLIMECYWNIIDDVVDEYIKERTN